MEVRVFDKKRLPGRHVTDGAEHARYRSPCDAVVGPEAAEGGPIGLLQDADFIDIDAVAGTVSVRVDEATFSEWRKAWQPRADIYTTGALWNYAQGVGPARKGAAAHPGGVAEAVSYADL